MKTRLILAATIAVASLFNSAQAQTAGLRAGAATSNITPKLGSEVVGGFAPFPAKHIHDELHARCLVLDDGKTKIALVVCDLLGFHRSLGVEARRLIQEKTGIPASNVLISATHTHSAASALGSSGYASEKPLDEYQKFVAGRIADGVVRATNLLRPAEIGFGTAEAPEHLFNRRWFLKEGAMPPNPFGKLDKVKMNPGGGPSVLLEPAGPTDPTISFIVARESSGRLISLFAAYSLHYVGDVGPAHVSSDYFGIFSETMRKLQNQGEADPPFVAMLANGTSGDVNNINFKNPRARKPTYGQMRYVAEDVANKVNAALAKVEWTNKAPLAAIFREPGIEWRKIDPELIEWARKTEASGSKDVVAQSYARRVQLLAKAQGPALVPLQVLKIGDICIGTSPCETFTETGLEFKKRSPFKKSFMVELSHAYLGYLPTPRHFDLGGYETWPGTNYLEPQASVKMMDQLLEMAGELARSGR